MRERKNVKSTIGAGERRSMTHEADQADDRDARTGRGSAREPQPHALPSTSASTSAVRPTVSAAMPGSRPARVAVSSRDSWVANSVTAIATTATGTLMKKIARQVTSSVSQPPTQRAERERDRRDARPGADRLAALLRAGTRW